MATSVARSVREERRLVTCMFVDVVGSTDLTLKMGAERLKRELGLAFGEISRIITAHGGTVEKYVGDAIYALFGAPIAHEDDALRALRAGEAIRAWCAAGDAHGHPFNVRVGIETGEAVVDLEATESTRQQMSVGPVVNIAARLQQRAEPGEVLVGPTAREATAGTAELEGLSEVELKGIGKLAVWRLVRVGGPAPAKLAFVGRDAELGLLALAHRRALQGRSVLTVVSGPPGQGKTRLVQEFLSTRADGAHVVATRCRPPEEVGTFAPLRQLLGVTALDALSELVSRVCADPGTCERVVAGLADSAGIATSPSLERLPQAEREDEVVQAWRSYVGMLGRDRLVILAVDDIHWADPLLVRLVDRLTFGGPRLLVLATARPEFAEASGIRPSGDRFFVELGGLERDEARALAAEAGAADERVLERAEGNPLFIVELARARTVAEMPLTLQGALGARLDELHADDRTLLAAAAVAGERFTAADATFLAGRESIETGQSLQRLTDLHFLDLSERGYRFHHGLLRDVAYGRLLTAERMLLHSRYATERPPSDVAALAYHWWEAVRPPDAEWVWSNEPALPDMRRRAYEAHLAAGTVHGDHFAIDRAAALLVRATSLADSDGQRARVEQSLGVAYRRVLAQDASWAHLTRALDLFRRTGDVPIELYVDLVSSAQWIGAFHVQPEESDVMRIADEGVARSKQARDVRSLARIRRAQAQYVMNKYNAEPERADSFLNEAIEAATASGDPAVRRQVLLTKAHGLRRQGRWGDSATVVEEAGELLDTGDALERLAYLRARGWHELHRGEIAAAEATARETVALVEPMGPHNKTHAWDDLGEFFQATGRWDELIELSHRAAKLVTEEEASAFCASAAGLIRGGTIAHALRGEREEALAILRAMPTTDIDLELMTAVPRALLGFPAPEVDAKLSSGAWGWWEWQYAAARAVILRRPDDAERALERMGRGTESSALLRAFAEGVREAIAELRGGPPAKYEALRKLGFVGWADILRRRVDSEY